MENPETKSEICPLCDHPAALFYSEEFFLCRNCSGVFRGKDFLPDPAKEKSRYDKHQNNPDDPGYVQFVSPISDYILKNYKKEERGLDFGAGPSSAVSKILKEKHYSAVSFDPFYENEPKNLQNRYHYIICCEVAEHFHHPKYEFEKLKKLLLPGGELLIMTHLRNDSVDFPKWYYKNDFTHVFFYSEATFHWIKNTFGFKTLVIEGRFIRLKTEN